jgi:hypothetical protein
MPCQYTFLKRFPTTWNRFGGLGKCAKISLCEAGKFYCEINYFIYELTSRLLRDKFFYLRVEFFLLPRGFSSSIGKYFFYPRPEDGRPMGWDKKGTANRNSPRPKRDCLE